MKTSLRVLKGNLFKFLSYLAVGIVIITLVFILGTITIRGLPAITPKFIFSSEDEVRGFGGAIGNAIAGTLLLSVSSTLLASPLALGTAIYLKRYAKESFFTSSLSFLLEVLSGTPSVVLGIFGFYIFVIKLKFFTGGYSMIAGTIALAILILPVIAKATENAIDSVPMDIEHASYAIGATKWETISKISIPYALPGIITGIMLGIGRAAEESAIVILTAGYTQYFPKWKIVHNGMLVFDVQVHPFQSFIATLPLAVYHGFEFPHLVDISESFGAAFVLILIVMGLNIITRIFLRRRKIG